MDTGNFVFAFVMLYLGPETFMPIISALAALGGVLLMFWQRIAGFFRKIFARIRRKETE